MELLRIICVVISALCVNAGVLPVEKCNLEDSTCMLAAVQKAAPIFMAGIPEIGIDVLDVMDMDDLAFDLSGLQFSLQGGKLKGLKTAVFDKVKWDLKKKHFDIEFHLDCTVKGHYKASGRILVLPITGDGKMKLTLKDLLLKFRIEYEIEKDAEGNDHVVPKKFTYEFDVREKATFHLTNLFNGDKGLSETLLKFLNDEWKTISRDFGKPMVEVAATKLYKNIATYMKAQPIKEIANV